jgi:outer membrane protein
MIPKLATFLIAGVLALPAQAREAPEWIVRVGVHPIQPQTTNHASLHVSDGVAFSASGTYMVARRMGIELFAAAPVEHDIGYVRDGEVAGKVAEVEHLPVALSAQYHFIDAAGRARAYVGIGLSYVNFINERTRGALAGADLDLASSLGLAAQAGLDLAIGGNWFVTIDARWLDIDTRARIDGRDAGNIEIDPYAVGMAIGRRF